MEIAGEVPSFMGFEDESRSRRMCGIAIVIGRGLCLNNLTSVERTCRDMSLSSHMDQ